MSEKHIWGPIATHPEDVGYFGALPLPHVQLGRAGGYIDLVFLPDPRRSGPKLVLIEAKHATNSESSDKVIGQLLKYYARALRIGTAGLAKLRECAERECAGYPRQGSLLSMGKALGTSQTEARRLLEGGDPLAPGDLALIVALDEFHNKQARRLGFIINTLRKHHNLPIEVFTVAGDCVQRCDCSDEGLIDAV